MTRELYDFQRHDVERMQQILSSSPVVWNLNEQRTGSLSGRWIELTQGYRTLVDDEELSRYRWCAVVQPKKGYGYVYAARNGLIRGRRAPIRLSRQVMGVIDAGRAVEVDHKNHNTLDNRRSNLRVVTRSQNMQNRRGATRHSTTGVRGVGWDKSRRKYIAYVRIDRQYINLGRFDDLSEAARVAADARRRLMTHAAA